MGYYSYFNLEIMNADGSPVDEKARKKLVKAVRRASEDAREALDCGGACANEAKWYGVEEDMKRFSARHPGILFEVRVEGEGSDDRYKLYCLGGESETCPGETVYPERTLGVAGQQHREEKE